MNNTKKSFKTLVGFFAFALLIFGLPTFASAQWRDNNRRDRDRGTNYSPTQLKNAVKRLKSDSRDFVKFVDRDLDRSRYDGRNREENINQLAKDFRDAINDLEKRVGNGRNLRDSQSEARTAMRIGNQIDRAMRRVRLSPNVENYWRNIDRQLEEVAQAYNGRRGWRS